MNCLIYNNIFKRTTIKPKHGIAQLLSSIQMPGLTEEQSAKCDISIPEDELKK